jgi:hypothetical protein
MHNQNWFSWATRSRTLGARPTGTSGPPTQRAPKSSPQTRAAEFNRPPN